MSEVQGSRFQGVRCFLAYTAILLALSLLTISLGTNWRNCHSASQDSVPCSPMVWNYDEWSARLITGSVIRYAAEGDRDVGGFMTAWDKKQQVRVVEFIEGVKGAHQHYPYVSNFGLQYFLAKHFSLGGAKLASAGLLVFSMLCGLGMALVAAGIVLFAERQFGRLSGIAVALAFVLSPLMILHAINPYWMIFLSFLPFMAVLTLYPRARTPGQVGLVAAFAGALVCLKALTGYEYLSSIALGAALPIIYYELAACERIDRAVIARILEHGSILGLFILLGFAVAVCAHVMKATLFFGSFAKGVMVFTVPLSYSTWDTPTGIRGDVIVNMYNVLAVTRETFLMRNLLITTPLYAAFSATALIMLMRCGGSPKRLWSCMDRAHRALALTWLAAIPASLSWMVLAARHSMMHAFINWILGYMFVHVFAAMLVGRNVSMLRTTLASGAVRAKDNTLVGT